MNAINLSLMQRVSVAIVIFISGWLASASIGNAIGPMVPSTESASSAWKAMSGEAVDRISPQDWVDESQIIVTSERVVIEVQGAVWAKFTDTKSMDPLLDKGANAIQIIPTHPDMIQVGDVISYETELIDGIIIHRVVEIGNDEEGWYAVTKGDNLSRPDPLKVRWEQVRRVLIAVIY